MSFSNEVRTELSGILPNARHCRISELAALVSMCLKRDEAGARDVLMTDIGLVVERIETLLGKLSGEEKLKIEIRKTRTGKKCYLLSPESGDWTGISGLVKLDMASGRISPNVYTQNCCKRAYLRGAFLAVGSITDPTKDYHLEIVANTVGQAEAIVTIFGDFDIDAKIIGRKHNYVVYIKDSEAIADALNVMEAHVALMELENVRIYKEVRNSINRRANCEVANIGKTVTASSRQIEDIKLLTETVGLDKLGEELEITARLRMENPEASLSELGGLHDVPLGRSGVNHRLKKLSELAQRVREGKPLR